MMKLKVNVNVLSEMLFFSNILSVFFINHLIMFNIVSHDTIFNLSLMTNLVIFVIFMLAIITKSFKINFFSFDKILGIVIYLVFILCNLLLFPQNRGAILNYASNFVVYSVPLILSFVFIEDYKSLFNDMYKITRYISLIIILTMILNIVGLLKPQLNYSMGLSNATLIFSCFMLCKILFFKKEKKDYIHLFVLTLFILIYGSKGSLIPLIFILIIYIMYSLTTANKKKVIISLMLLFSICIMIIYLDYVLDIIKYTFDFFGINSRTIDMLSSDSGLSLSLGSRQRLIYNALDEFIVNNNSLLNGMGTTSTLLGGGNSHSLLREVWIDTGILGFVLLGLLFIKQLHEIKVEINSFCIFKLIFFSIGIGLVIFSGSLWANAYFGLWICTVTYRTR